MSTTYHHVTDLDAATIRDAWEKLRSWADHGVVEMVDYYENHRHQEFVLTARIIDAVIDELCQQKGERLVKRDVHMEHEYTEGDEAE